MVIDSNSDDLFSEFRRSLNAMGVGLVDGSLEIFDRDILRALLKNLKSPIVLDVGAHQGGFAANIFEINSRSTIYAFEPNIASFQVLQSLKAPAEGKIISFNIAVGSKNGEATLYHSMGEDDSPLSSLHREVIEDLHGQPSTGDIVQVQTLDSLIFELGIPAIHLLKLDMEGSELDALKGAEKVLREGRIQAIHFEFNDMNIISRTFFKDFWDLLHKNYKLYRLSPAGPIHIAHYMPMYCELFAVQTIVAVSEPR